MIKRIVGFGDSWIHGDGLVDVTDSTKQSFHYRVQNSIIGQLAECLQIPYDSANVVNHGTSGNSLQGTQWDFAQWAQSENNFDNTLIVVGLTESARQSWWRYQYTSRSEDYEVNYVHAHAIGKYPEWSDFIKFYQINANDPSLWKINYWLITEFFHNWAVANNTKLLMFNIFPAPIESPHVIDPHWNARGELARIEHEIGNVTAPCKHPNEKGYQLLAKHLHKLLQSSKIL